MPVTYSLLDHFHIWVRACYSHWEGFDEDNFYVEVSLGWETTPYHPVCTWGEDSLPCVCQAKLLWSLGSESGPGDEFPSETHHPSSSSHFPLLPHHTPCGHRKWKRTTSLTQLSQEKNILNLPNSAFSMTVLSTYYIFCIKRILKPGLCLQEEYSPAGKDGCTCTCTSTPACWHTRMQMHAHTHTHPAGEHGKPWAVWSWLK